MKDKRDINTLCKTCHKSFDRYRKRHIYCSPNCREISRRKTKKRRDYMAKYMRDYYKTENGRKNIIKKNRKWEMSKDGRVFRKNRKAKLRGSIGTWDKDYFDFMLKIIGGCISCGSNKDIQVDHVVPISKGGKNVNWNIQPLCSICNKKKSGKLLLSHMDNVKLDLIYGEWLLCQ